MYNYFSESESDSDSNPDSASYQSNQDNASAQRSATTGGATAGSDTGISYIFVMLCSNFLFWKYIIKKKNSVKHLLHVFYQMICFCFH